MSTTQVDFSPGRFYASVQRRQLRRLLSFMALVAVLALVDLSVGPAGLTLGEWLAGLTQAGSNPLHDAIVWEIRLPQMLMALVVGFALGLAGAEMQTVLDNPLASPFTLGVSSASALGAALALMTAFTLPGLSSAATLGVCALVAGLACVALLDRLSRSRLAAGQGLILFGIALVFSINALLSLLQYVLNAGALQNLMFWMMGSLSRSNLTWASWLAALTLVCLGLSLRDSWQLSALRFGEERARSLGVNSQALRRRSLFRVGVLTAAAVSGTGIIGFIGLVAPHMARRLAGEDHRWLMPLSGLVGSALLLGAATLTKIILPFGTLPVGIVTTLVGIPALVFLMRRQTP